MVKGTKRPEGRNQMGLPPGELTEKTSSKNKVLQCNIIKRKFLYIG